jgi:hypothetical protein
MEKKMFSLVWIGKGDGRMKDKINKTLIRWSIGGFIVFILCAALMIVVFHPYEIRFSADTNIKEAIIATSKAIETQRTITEQPIILDLEKYRDYCGTESTPDVVACVIGCREAYKQMHLELCETTTCILPNELDCDSFCGEKY